MESNSEFQPIELPARASRKKSSTKSTSRRQRIIRPVVYVISAVLLIGVLAISWLFLTPSGTELRYVIADTLLTTQHRHWAKYVIGKTEFDNRVKQYQESFNEMGNERDNHTIPVGSGAGADGSGLETAKELVEIEEISGKGYSGYVMTVNDPKKIRLGIPEKSGKGEKVMSMVTRTGAIAGVNGGGFVDPNWQGNGFQPIGIVISQGKLYYNDLGGKNSTQVVGLDRDGKLVAGRYTLQEIEDMGVQEAVTFQPRLIVNGKGLIKDAADGWGIAPRTAMGQRADGAILFVVIDGRQPGYSIGANLYDVQQIMLEHGAVIAANLDGGSSTVLVHDGQLLNKPSSKSKDGRYLPTAFLVFEHPDSVSMPNVWEGLRPKDIDASKW